MIYEIIYYIYSCRIIRFSIYSIHNYKILEEKCVLANYLSHRTLFGTSVLLKEKQLHPAELKDMVSSPGGTTITALRHLEKSGVRSALMEAVVAAAERSRELA